MQLSESSELKHTAVRDVRYLIKRNSYVELNYIQNIFEFAFLGVSDIPS